MRASDGLMRCVVAIPVFNQRPFIDRAVRSALDQSVEGLEVVIVDNCSTDGTWEAIQGFASEGVKILRNPENLGLFGNFNRCLEAAGAPYLRILCGDDFLPTGCLAREVALLERHPEVAMLSTRGRFVDPRGCDIGVFADDFPAGIYDGPGMVAAWLGYYAHYRRNPLNYPSGVMIRRAAAAGLKFDERYVTTGDIDFFLRLLERGDLAITDSFGSCVTRHPLQAHTGPNLDGRAIREHVLLYEAFAAKTDGGPALKAMRRQLGGMSLGLALHRALSITTRESARIHAALAIEIAPGWMGALGGLTRIVFCRLAKMFLGARAPYIARPMRPLRSG